jgi:hypothetical protein
VHAVRLFLVHRCKIKICLHGVVFALVSWRFASLAFLTASARFSHATIARAIATTNPKVTPPSVIRLRRVAALRLARMYSVWSGVGFGSLLVPAAASHCSADRRSSPRRTKLLFLPFVSPLDCTCKQAGMGMDPIKIGIERADETVSRFFKIIALPKENPV